jgi:hypothetical protein
VTGFQLVTEKGWFADDFAAGVAAEFLTE